MIQQDLAPSTRSKPRYGVPNRAICAGHIAGAEVSNRYAPSLSFDLSFDLSFNKAAAALEQIRGIVGHLAALFIKVAALVESIAADVGKGFAALRAFLFR